jgi:hypothetical protein
MSATPLRKLYRSIGKTTAQDKKTCSDLLKGLKGTAASSLASMFRESLEVNSHFDGTKQPFLNAASLKSRTKLTSGSRGDNRIVFLLSTKKEVLVSDGPRGYSFHYVGRQVPPFRQEGAGAPRSGAGGIDYTAVADKTPVLGEIKRSGDKNAFYAFVQLLTYLSEMATANQVARATKHEEFGVALKHPQRFDLHVLLTDLNPRSATQSLIGQTHELAEAFRKSLGKEAEKVLGKILCLQMDSAEFADDAAPALHCDWVA